MRCCEIKRGESKLASSHLCTLYSLDRSEVFTELYREEEREEVDRGNQEKEQGNLRGESKLASNHFPMCSPQSESLRDVQGVIQRREEGGRRQRWPGG